MRPGIALYGGLRSESLPGLRDVVALEARILQVRDANAGDPVGYGSSERLKRDSRLAALSIGYADGFLRQGGSSDAAPGGRVWTRGRIAPIIGRISMDITMADVTEVPGVVSGDWVEMFGPNLPIEDAAGAAGTLSYEMLTGLSHRASRRYVGGTAQ